MNTLRINGLIRAFRSIRAQLQAGIPPEEADRFRRTVTALIDDVLRICQRHGTPPERLPGPSRQAFNSLLAIDLTRLPLRQPDLPTHTPPPVRLKNVIRIGTGLAEDLWRETVCPASDGLAEGRFTMHMEDHAWAIERCCADRGSHPAGLERPSRDVYCWIKFLARNENLAAHRDALDRAWRLMRSILPALDHLPTLHLVKTASVLWRLRRRGPHHPVLIVSQGFLHAEDEVWRALLQAALRGKDPALGGIVRDFADSEEYGSVLLDMESSVQTGTGSGRGRVHDLNASFERVNAAYFNGAMARPSLAWNRIPTACKFGHYDAARDQVMMSLTLDAPEVPEWLVDFVLYHELLHKRLGVARINGRRQIHSPAFRAEERRFHRHAEAEQALEELARQASSSPGCLNAW